jgi:hypothetical protein
MTVIMTMGFLHLSNLHRSTGTKVIIVLDGLYYSLHLIVTSSHSGGFLAWGLHVLEATWYQRTMRPATLLC